MCAAFSSSTASEILGTASHKLFQVRQDQAEGDGRLQALEDVGHFRLNATIYILCFKMKHRHACRHFSIQLIIFYIVLDAACKIGQTWSSGGFLADLLGLSSVSPGFSHTRFALALDAASFG